MKCPICRQQMIEGGMLRLETLSEHVMSPNSEVSLKPVFNCSDKKCVGSYSMMHTWSKNGEYFVLDYGFLSAQETVNGQIPFIDNNSAPFGSIQRKLNVEIYKNDENKRLPITLFNKDFIFEIEVKYDSNLDGDILKRRYRLNLWINSMLYISGLSMLIYAIGDHFKSRYKGTHLHSAYDSFEYPTGRYAEDWWRWAKVFILRHLDLYGYFVYLKEKRK